MRTKLARCNAALPALPVGERNYKALPVQDAMLPPVGERNYKAPGCPYNDTFRKKVRLGLCTGPGTYIIEGTPMQADTSRHLQQTHPSIIQMQIQTYGLPVYAFTDSRPVKIQVNKRHHAVVHLNRCA